jgi:hypothetical protein
MKKTILLAGICAVLFFMPVFCALPIKTANKSQQKILPTLEEYDGTFIGGFGRIYKENEEWQFEYNGYLGGVYKNYNRFKVIYGNIYNLDKQQIGTIGVYNFKSVIYGRIKNMEGQGAPIVGFLFINEDLKFAGRLMSFFGPAPHIWGEFTPN